MDATTTLTSILKSQGHSVTNARTSVTESLARLGPSTMRTLTGDLQNTIDRATIYRVVALFEELGIVKRIPIGWKYKIELGDMFNDHHHHAHCTSCERLLTLEHHDRLERVIKEVAKENNLELTAHSLELHGLCNACQKTATT
jgi:Fur family ferric uptake transcriptional regulator